MKELDVKTLSFDCQCPNCKKWWTCGKDDLKSKVVSVMIPTHPGNLGSPSYPANRTRYFVNSSDAASRNCCYWYSSSITGESVKMKMCEKRLKGKFFWKDSLYYGDLLSKKYFFQDFHYHHIEIIFSNAKTSTYIF